MSYKIFEKAKVLICVGSGGVGKTTVAAALAVVAARAGKKVLVLTIDPSKRLAQTLGIEGQKDIVKVPDQNFAGEIFAGVIDHKKTFDEFLARAASKSGALEKMFNNRLYQQLSTNLASSQEFTSLEKLYAAYESKQYDLIILDTPPSKHAIDFLNAPQKLSALFSENITKWFKGPEKVGLLSSLINTGTRQVLKVLEMLTGGTFIKELADFFSSIEAWQGKLQERTLNVHRMLTSSETQFCLVTSFDEAQLSEAKKLSREVRKGGYNLNAVILNRAFPSWDLNAVEAGLSSEAAEIFTNFQKYFKNRQLKYDQFIKDLPADVDCYRLADFNQDISDLNSLGMVSAQLEKSLK
ncbi:MAG: ArsA family ATPase [Bdellovibrionia bacterium]